MTEPRPPSVRLALLGRIATYAPSSLIPAAVTLLTSVIFTRLFAPDAFGMYGLFLVVATPTKLVLTTWLTQSVGRFLPQATTGVDRRRIKDAISLSICGIVAIEGTLSLTALAVLRPALSDQWRTFLAPTLSFIVITSVFEVLSTVFSMEDRAREYVSYRLIDSLATFALRLLLAYGCFRLDITLMFWSVVASNAVLLPVMWRRAGLTHPRLPTDRAWSTEARQTSFSFLTFGIPMTVWYFSGILLDIGDRYVLNYLLGPAAVGVYDANYRLISGLATIMIIPVSITLYPYLMSISSSGDDERIGSVISAVVEKLVLVGVLCVGAAFIIHGEIARVLLGAQFREGSVIMPLVLAGVFLFNVGLYAHKPFEIRSRTREMVALGLVCAAVNLGLCFLLIPPLGYVGAAYATLLAYLLYAVCIGFLGRRLIAWRLQNRGLLMQAGAILAGLASVALLREATSGLPSGWNAGITVTSLALVGLAFAARIILRPAPGAR